MWVAMAIIFLWFHQVSSNSTYANQSEAEDACNNSLPLIESESDQDYLLSVMRNSSADKPVWLANKKTVFSYWKTTDNKEKRSSYITKRRGNCATMDRNGEFYCTPCLTSNVSVVCILKGNCTSSECAPGENPRLKLIENVRNWFAARRQCHDIDGKMLTDDNQKELIYAQKKSGEFWLGLYRETWSTKQFSEHPEYSNWKPGSRNQNKSCVVMEPESGWWRAESCLNQHTYICLHELRRRQDKITSTPKAAWQPDAYTTRDTPPGNSRSHLIIVISVSVGVVILVSAVVSGVIIQKKKTRIWRSPDFAFPPKRPSLEPPPDNRKTVTMNPVGVDVEEERYQSTTGLNQSEISFDTLKDGTIRMCSVQRPLDFRRTGLYFSVDDITDNTEEPIYSAPSLPDLTTWDRDVGSFMPPFAGSNPDVRPESQMYAEVKGQNDRMTSEKTESIYMRQDRLSSWYKVPRPRGSTGRMRYRLSSGIYASIYSGNHRPDSDVYQEIKDNPHAHLSQHIYYDMSTEQARFVEIDFESDIEDTGENPAPQTFQTARKDGENPRTSSVNYGHVVQVIQDGKDNDRQNPPDDISSTEGATIGLATGFTLDV